MWLSPFRVLDVVHGSEGGFVELEDHNGGAPLASRSVPRLTRSPEEQEGRVGLLFVMFLG